MIWNLIPVFEWMVAILIELNSCLRSYHISVVLWVSFFFTRLPDHLSWILVYGLFEVVSFVIKGLFWIWRQFFNLCLVSNILCKVNCRLTLFVWHLTLLVTYWASSAIKITLNCVLLPFRYIKFMFELRHLFQLSLKS